MRKFGVIGHPLTHSFSPAYFKEKFKREGVEDADFQAYPIDSIEDLLPLLFQYPEIEGLTVTIPYKETILPKLDFIDEVAQNVGAVNAIKINRKESAVKLYGFNTDVIGFEKALLEGWILPSKALILGTGGAAKAVQYVLKKLDIDYMLISRKANEFTLSYEQLNDDIVNEHKLIINTTPVGMYPNIEERLPLPFQSIDSEHYLYDLIYNPLETNFLKIGRAQGAHIKNGLKMLYLQADAFWNIVTTFEE
ncbi:MAG: shikimate dehydrogenase [Bacteroidales bacterium]